MIKILDVLNKQNIIVLQTATYDEVIKTLLDTVKGEKSILDHDALCKAITEREELVSTGIGLGLAVPHARQDGITDFVVAAVLVKDGVDWKSIDDEPVHFAVLIASPKDSHKLYLNLLSQIVLFWKKDSIRQNILAANNSDEIYKILQDNL